MPSPLLAQGIDLNHYCKIHIDGSKLQLTAHAINGAVIDRFELTRNADTQLARAAVETDQAKKIISRYQELLLDLSKLARGPLDPHNSAKTKR